MAVNSMDELQLLIFIFAVLYKTRYISPICTEAPHGRICTKFGTAVGAADVITCTNFLVIGKGVWILWG